MSQKLGEKFFPLGVSGLGGGEARRLAELDQAYCWHPFTPMQEWCQPENEPLILHSASGAVVRDVYGREYLDGNSSIWTNLHGHGRREIVEAVCEQARRMAHVSFLGAGHDKASLLAEKLTGLLPGRPLPRVFFSDDGSTSIEVALKMAAQFWQQNGKPERTLFAVFDGAYHGDTAGASSLGGVALFHARFAAWHFPVLRVRSVEELEASPEWQEGKVAAVVIEPLIQGVNRMALWPQGMLRELRRVCDEADVFLILDEVLTGFGRTGEMFACQHEGVVPDILCLAKGLTGGVTPLAATLTTERIFEGFWGAWHEGRTLFYGHSFTAHAIGCAAALANLAIFEKENTLETVREKAALLARLLADLKSGCPWVGAVRQLGLLAGIDLAHPSGAPLPPLERAGFRVCASARRHGLLTRNISDTIVLIPPYCTTREQLEAMVGAIRRAVGEVLGGREI